jgi:hypothetical protein
MSGGRAELQIIFSTHLVTASLPVAALLNLDHVPASRRVAYYSPSVAELPEEDLGLLAADLVPPVAEPDPPGARPARSPEPPQQRHQRGQAVARWRRNAFQGYRAGRDGGGRDGEIAAPKNLFMVYVIIKTEILKRVDPHYNWRTYVDDFPEEALTPAMLLHLAPKLGIPINTPNSERRKQKYREPRGQSKSPGF